MHADPLAFLRNRIRDSRWRSLSKTLSDLKDALILWILSVFCTVKLETIDLDTTRLWMKWPMQFEISYVHVDGPQQSHLSPLSTASTVTATS
jgi:hypothetical protein